MHPKVHLRTRILMLTGRCHGPNIFCVHVRLKVVIMEPQSKLAPKAKAAERARLRSRSPPYGTLLCPSCGSSKFFILGPKGNVIQCYPFRHQYSKDQFGNFSDMTHSPILPSSSSGHNVIRSRGGERSEG